jgi:hypothetical protein
LQSACKCGGLPEKNIGARRISRPRFYPDVFNEANTRLAMNFPMDFFAFGGPALASPWFSVFFKLQPVIGMTLYNDDLQHSLKELSVGKHA